MIDIELKDGKVYITKCKSFEQSNQETEMYQIVPRKDLEELLKGKKIDTVFEVDYYGGAQFMIFLDDGTELFIEPDGEYGDSKLSIDGKWIE